MIFPGVGKFRKDLSGVWKNPGNAFQGLEIFSLARGIRLTHRSAFAL
jgi:hypothetical protein